MAFSSVLGASSVIRPGVCTSTTRPTVPYEGQLIYETDTDRVASYNGSAWVYTHSSGMVLLATAALSSVTSFSLDNIFSSQYENFRIVIRNTGNAATVTMQLRTGGVAATTNYHRQETYSASTSLTAARTTGQPSILIGAFGSLASFASIDLYAPNLAQPTIANVRSTHGGSFDIAQPIIFDIITFHTTATAYDGFAVTAANANTLIGRYWVYGLAGAA